MTAIAKTLVFLTLVLGMGAAVLSTAVYTQRPSWFRDAPEAAPKGHVVLTFKGLAKDIDTQGKASAAASALWGKQRKELEAAEADRKARADAIADLLTKARTGATGFYEIEEDPVTGRLNVLEPGKAVKGPDGKALAGADTLVALIAAASDRIANDLTPKIAKHRADQKRLGIEIDVFAAKVVRQRTIREDLQNEASYLAAAEVNVAEQRVTAVRRLRQLEARLREFAPKN
jgi:hypothetical protein